MSRLEGFALPPGESGANSSEMAENMVVFKVSTHKQRRYVLAVPYEQIVPVMVAFARHVAFAKASMKFRREFGSAVPSKLTLGERIGWAANKYVVTGL